MAVLACFAASVQHLGCSSDPSGPEPDTDGDGLSDREELNVYGTSPVMADTDGDGFNDYQEVVTLGFDPGDNPYRFNPRVADVPLMTVVFTSPPVLVLETSDAIGTMATTTRSLADMYQTGTSYSESPMYGRSDTESVSQTDTNEDSLQIPLGPTVSDTFMSGSVTTTTSSSGSGSGSSSGSTPELDAGSDGGFDAELDAGTDAELDATVDAGIDASPHTRRTRRIEVERLDRDRLADHGELEIESDASGSTSDSSSGSTSDSGSGSTSDSGSGSSGSSGSTSSGSSGSSGSPDNSGSSMTSVTSPTESVTVTTNPATLTLTNSVSTTVNPSTTFSTSITYTAQQTQQFSETLTREISYAQMHQLTLLGAGLKVEAIIENRGPVAFRVTNLILGAAYADAAGNVVPIQNLNVDEGFLTTYQPFSLAPGQQSGFTTFSTLILFLQTAQQIIANMHQLLLGIAVYELSDATGKQFAFDADEIGAKTALVTIDYGGPSSPELYQVATDLDPAHPGVTAARVFDDILRIPYAASPQTGLTSVRNTTVSASGDPRWIVSRRHDEGPNIVTTTYGRAGDPYDFDAIELHPGDVLQVALARKGDASALSRGPTSGSQSVTQPSQGRGLDYAGPPTLDGGLLTGP